MHLASELTFALIFVAVILIAGGANALLDRVLAQYRRNLGGDPTSVTEWSRRVESVRTRIEARSQQRFMRGQPPLDKDAELRRLLGVPERS
jgi:hypothetical protein